MRGDLGFLILTLVVMIIVCCTADMWVAFVTCVALANIYFISMKHSEKISISYAAMDEPPQETPAEAPPSTAPEYADPDPNMRYGADQREYDAFITSYSKCYSPIAPVTVDGFDLDRGIDSRNAIIAQARARDKKSIDGAVTKDANFYRHHFAAELDEAERKEWWGESEW